MMKIADYLDSTYLKTPKQAGLSDSETLKKVRELTHEAIEHEIYAVMVRPDYVHSLRMLLDELHANVKLGTVIDFPEGRNSVKEKIEEAQKALANGADELDFVVDYTAFKNGNLEKVKEEIESCSRLVLNADKAIKWIIETAALSQDQIAQITALIRDIALENLSEFSPENIFVKSSTGFYATPEGTPNGATPEVIQCMIENAGPLPVKASGGVRSKEEAERMIGLGVKRIGTSSALAIATGKIAKTDY
ncbi:MAG TPA: deoxyribose-phosphate aldolase [Moheibacter sp.]|nr:deoxyribose-phosphate aldolase [Moheibacter sp.]